MALSAAGAELPCRNPNCKSKGMSHPNCRCYGGAADVGRASGRVSKASGPAMASSSIRANMAEGGLVEEHYCSSGREHQEGCEHYKDGGRVQNLKATKHAHAYMKAQGLPISKSTYHPVDPARAKAIAQEFQKMEHNPTDPEVKAAYEALNEETLAQFQQMKKAGLKIEKIKPGQENPYKSSGDLHKDIEKGHMWFYPTEQGFGSLTDVKDHPLLKPTMEVVDGHQMLANDVFRVVHDYFGHAKEGYGFGPRGEENAWREHSKMYSKRARRALTTETRGQNSWVNFGPYGQQNQERPAETTYADQKAGLLPEWVSEDPGELVHYSQHPGDLKSIDPKFMGTGRAGRESKRTGRIPRQYFYEPGSQPEDLVMQGAKKVHKISRPHDILDIASEDAAPILQNARDEDHMEELIHEAGFSGYKNSASQIPGAIALFGEHPVVDSEDITPAHFKKAAGYAEGGEVTESEPMDRIGSQCLQDALSNGFLRGHGEISDAILGHGDAKPLVAAIIANGGAPSLLKMGSSSVFTPRVAMKRATTADRTQAFLSGVGASHHAGLPSSFQALETGLDHPWFRRGAAFHRVMPELQADPKADHAWESMAEKLLGRDVHGAAQEFLAPMAIKLLAQGADPDEFEHGIHFAEHIGKGLHKIDKALKNIFDPEAEEEMPDIKTRQKIHEYVSKGKLNDDMVEQLSEQSAPLTEGTDPIAKHFPDQNLLLQQTKGAMVNHLNSVRPYAQPGLTFDTPFTTKLAQRQYDQALDVAANPLSLFGKIKKGSLTLSDINSVAAMYPDLYDIMKTKLTEKLVDMKVNKESVAPSVRRSMALFLGTPLDTTMTPASIQNVQAMYAKQRQASQAQQPQAGGKGGPAKLDKVAQGAQTDSQALAARQQRPR